MCNIEFKLEPYLGDDGPDYRIGLYIDGDLAGCLTDEGAPKLLQAFEQLLDNPKNFFVSTTAVEYQACSR